MAPRLRWACLLLLADPGLCVAQSQLLAGHWVAEENPTLPSLEFRGGDTLWTLIPIAAISQNGHGSYEYTHGQIILHYGEGLSDSVGATVRAPVMILTSVDGQHQDTAALIAPVRGAQSPLHGTWSMGSTAEQVRLMTFLPGGVFFQEGAFVARYTIADTTVTITTPRSQAPMVYYLQVRGADTVLAPADSERQRFRRPHCGDPQLDPQKAFTSTCS